MWASGWGYVRLRRSDYDRGELSAWLRRLREQGWQDVFVFFKREDQGHGPRLAQELLALAAAPLGT